MGRHSLHLALASCLALSLAGACDPSPFSPLPDTAVVRWGTSFGECLGYCRQTLEVTRDRLRLVREGTDAAHPTLTWESALPAGAWATLGDTVEASGIEGLHHVYGCPDCADGGAEWVEVEAPGATRRVTFEYGDAPTELASLVADLRSLRATLGTPQG
jgi:hypothetical protein